MIFYILKTIIISKEYGTASLREDVFLTLVQREDYILTQKEKFNDFQIYFYKFEINV